MSKWEVGDTAICDAEFKPSSIEHPARGDVLIVSAVKETARGTALCFEGYPDEAAWCASGFGKTNLHPDDFIRQQGAS